VIRYFLLLLALAFASSQARADTPLTLFKTYAGNVNFTGTVASMRNSNTYVCSVYGSGTTLSMALSGIPTTATIVSAQLYWAGSGSTSDYTVGFESGNVTSTAARSYTSASIGSGLNYFSGAVDVTQQVIARRNGNYQFFNLAANTGNPWCSSSAVLSGFSLLVVYSDAGEPYRVLNLYEGFQYYRSNSVTTTMTGFRVPNSLTSAMTGRIGHITWEGDPAASTGEDVTFNGTKMTDATYAPSGNQFNSRSSISNNTTSSLGIDFDDFDVAAPIIASGQTSATSVYATGTDMVLLSALILAAPSDTLVDLGVTMTRNGAFTSGTSGSYTLSVYNYGPGTENGPITLVDTLPAGVTFVSAAGTRWSCSASGQTVTCVYNGLFTTNTALPDITLTVLPTTAGSITNTASVSGVGYDTATANNAASDTTTVARGAYSYVFTDIACKPNIAFGTTGQCNIITADMRIPAATSIDAYLTVISNGLPVARSTTAATSVPLYFAMTCVLPVKNAGVKPIINTVALPVCTDGPNAPAATTTAAWSPVITLSFPANVPSSKITFYYADVGRLQLSVREATGAVSTSPTVISRPVSLRMTIPGNPAAVASTSAPFVPAGQAFPVNVDALMSNGVAAPNFGNGDATITLSATRPSSSVADDAAMSAAMGAFPNLVTTGLATASGGVFNATAMFDEVGVIVLTAGINGYYFSINDVTVPSTKVGRFYPASFSTTVTPVFAACGDTGATTCPANVGAAYATQGFDVAVKPLDVANKEVLNFRGVFGHPIDLSAVDSAGGTTVNPPATPAGAKLTAPQIPALAATDTNASLHASVSYALPVPFLYTKVANSAWTLPTPIFLRANSVDSAALTVTSKQATASLEDGIMILNGRLLLSTVSGSELLRLPVTMSAQFWNKPAGATAPGWYVNPADAGATPTAILFSACKRNLLVSNACYSGLTMTPKDTAFTKGVGRFFIPAPGPGKTGSAMFIMTGAPAWLPTTIAQAVFGVYKSNFIYLREMY
jgi:MSHA biogenesis protein MshQ